MNIKAVIAIILILLLAFSGYIVYLNKKIVGLKEQLVSYEVSLVEAKGEAERLVKEYEAIINGLEEEKKKAEAKISELQDIQKGLSGVLSELENEREQLQDKDAIIQNLDRQIELWKAKFTLAQKEIEEKDKIIFSLNKQYEIQLKITQEFQRKYELELASRLRLEKTFRELVIKQSENKKLNYLTIGFLALIAGITIASK